MKYSSLIQQVVDCMGYLPGIGERTALQLVLHMLKKDKRHVQELSQALCNLVDNIKYCAECHALADDRLCTICANEKRDHSVICVVADIYDVMFVEKTQKYEGMYYVLGGVINPLQGVYPDHLRITQLKEHIQKKPTIKEVLLAIENTLEGDTTIQHIVKQLQNSQVNISTIARGIPSGSELEAIDEITLGRSIQERVHLVK